MKKAVNQKKGYVGVQIKEAPSIAEGASFYDIQLLEISSHTDSGLVHNQCSNLYGAIITCRVTCKHVNTIATFIERYTNSSWHTSY